MAAVTVRIPRLLAEVGDGRRQIPVDADTVAGALEALFVEVPQLRVHVIDESGGIRQHVSCFHNKRSAKTPQRLAGPVADGDVVTILQAVSGGGLPVPRSPLPDDE
jgi:molybdopterin converting factor small subunit